MKSNNWILGANILRCKYGLAFSEVLHNLQSDKDDKENEILELYSRLGKCHSEMAAISNKLSDAEESMNKLLKERSEHILKNMKKLNEERESRGNIGTNSKNHKAPLQGETNA
jgi:DNA anti-recombination protein RmuC